MADEPMANEEYLRDRDSRDGRLRGINLEGENLSNFDLHEVDLTGANLDGATLEGANLTYATLEGANLSYADLTGSDLEGANLEGAQLQGAGLTDVNLTDVNLTDANLIDASLRRARAINANLQGVQLQDADLTGANLRGADLTGSDLEGANLEGVNLRGANLNNTNSRNVNFINADITGTTFHGATLEGAFFTEQEQEQEPDVAYEVHTTSNRMFNNEKFLQTIGVTSSTTADFDYSAVKTQFVDFINDDNNFTSINKEELISNLNQVISKILLCDPTETTPENAKRMNQAVLFAFNQDKRFTEAYISVFIDETHAAYSGDGDTTSCTAGIRERFYMSLLGAAAQVYNIEGFVKTSEITTLYCLSKIGIIQPDPNSLMEQWSESWDGKLDEWQGMDVNGRKEHIMNFMREEYKKDDCYEVNKEDIEKTIKKKAEEISYVFEDQENAAQFGGGKRKTKKSKTTKKTKKTKKTRNRKQKNKRVSRKGKQKK